MAAFACRSTIVIFKSLLLPIFFLWIALIAVISPTIAPSNPSAAPTIDTSNKVFVFDINDETQCIPFDHFSKINDINIGWIKIMSCNESQDSSTFIWHQDALTLASYAISAKLTPQGGINSPDYESYSVETVPYSNPVDTLNAGWELSWQYNKTTGELNIQDLNDWIGSSTAVNRLNQTCTGGSPIAVITKRIYHACGNFDGIHLWDWDVNYRRCQWDEGTITGKDIEMYFGFPLSICPTFAPSSAPSDPTETPSTSNPSTLPTDAPTTAPTLSSTFPTTTPNHGYIFAQTPTTTVANTINSEFGKTTHDTDSEESVKNDTDSDSKRRGFSYRYAIYIVVSMLLLICCVSCIGIYIYRRNKAIEMKKYVDIETEHPEQPNMSSANQMINNAQYPCNMQATALKVNDVMDVIPMGVISTEGEAFEEPNEMNQEGKDISNMIYESDEDDIGEVNTAGGGVVHGNRAHILPPVAVVNNVMLDANQFLNAAVTDEEVIGDDDTNTAM